MGRSSPEKQRIDCRSGFRIALSQCYSDSNTLKIPRGGNLDNPLAQFEKEIDRIEEAVLRLAQWFEEAGLHGGHRFDEIARILKGETTIDEPISKSQTDRRINDIEEAISVMARRLVTHTAFTAQDAEEIDRILQGETSKT